MKFHLITKANLTYKIRSLVKFCNLSGTIKVSCELIHHKILSLSLSLSFEKKDYIYIVNRSLSHNQEENPTFKITTEIL